MRLAGKIEYLIHKSSVLENNPLGDPHERQLPVYLPPSYNAASKLPVIFVLAPFTSWGERYFNLKAWDPNIIQRYEEMLALGEAEPVLMAFPDCFTTYGGSQYVNSSAVGNYRDYVIDELIPYVDQQFATAPDRRGIMGYSSGGYGALMLTMAYPQLFRAAASHSGDMAFDMCYVQDIPGAVRGIEQAQGIGGVIEGLKHTRSASRDWFSALHLVAMSACYSPNPAAEYGFELPFDSYTGGIIEAVWQKWLAQDPVNAVSKHLDRLRSLDLLFFDCGIFDEFNLFLGARQLHKLLQDASIDHIYEEFNGSHRDINWRYDTSLPLLTKALTTGLN